MKVIVGVTIGISVIVMVIALVVVRVKVSLGLRLGIQFWEIWDQVMSLMFNDMLNSQCPTKKSVST